MASTQKAEFPLKSIEEVLPIIAGARTFIVADTETTGFGAYDDIIEIGAVRIDTETRKIMAQFSTYCQMKNHKKVPPKITELTGIRTEDLVGAPNIETALTEFKKFIGSDPLVFHNAAFDWRMLNTKYKMLGTRLHNECICSFRLFKYLHPEVGSGNLDVVTSYYGTPIVGHHRAYVDCKWTAAAFCRMRQEVIDQGITPSLTGDDPNLFTPAQPKTITLDDLNRRCMVQRITGWKKNKVQRIYCTTNMADFFYDLNQHVWNVARNKTDADLNTDVLAKFILNHLNLDLAAFQARYAPK